MRTVNVNEAKTQLSRLLDAVDRGESVIIAKAGRPVACLGPLSPPEPRVVRRLGFMPGLASVPDDFDRMGDHDIAELFEGPR